MINVILAMFILYNIKSIFSRKNFLHISICVPLFSVGFFVLGFENFHGMLGGLIFFIISYVFIVFMTSMGYIFNFFNNVLFILLNFYALFIIFYNQTKLFEKYIIWNYFKESPYIMVMILISLAYIFLHVRKYNQFLLDQDKKTKMDLKNS